jgi:protein ImuB
MPPSRFACARLPAPSSQALMELAECAEAFSPRFEAVGNCLYLDVTGVDSEASVGEALLKKIKAHAGGVGIASNKRVAMLAAALGTRQPRGVPAGHEAAFVAPLPVAALEPSETLSDTFARWGIRTAGDLARLPSKKIIATLGKEGFALFQAARGIDRTPLVPLERTPVFVERLDFDWAIQEAGPLLFHAQTLFDRLTTQLRRSGLACQRLEISLKLDPTGERRRFVRLRAPTDESKTLMRLLQGQLMTQTLDAPVTGLVFVAHPNQPRPAQLSLFGPPAGSPAQIATTLAELSALLGADRVGSPEILNTYKPEAVRLSEYDPPPVPLFAIAAAAHTAMTVIRVLRPALPAVVASLNAWPWTPQHLSARSSGALRIEGQVRTAAGPWRIEERWWTSTPVVREYWDLALSDGGLYRAFQDARQKLWFVDGVYD